jgi:hypothetical protein
MNPQIALSMVLLILFTLIFISFFLPPRREECLNAADPAPEKPKAEKPKAADAAPMTSAEKEAAAEVAAYEVAKAPKGVSEEAIVEKTRLGITREQAIEIITRQAAWDAEQAKEAAKVRK